MDDILKFLGNDELTVSEAMKKIDDNTYGILFLTDAGGILSSCITDGDIRRFLLSGGGLDAPAIL